MLAGVVVLALVAACLAALAKPFHVDDTLFVRGARALAEHGDPLAFRVNWVGTEQPAALAVLNPPLEQALLALVGSFAGYGEMAMHVPSLLAVLLLALAVARLADVVRVSRRWAQALVLTSPAVLVCAGNVMPDVMCAAFATLGVAAWCEALRGGLRARLALAVAALSAAALTKYTGVLALVPCAAFALAERGSLPARALARRAAWLAIPVLALVAYDRWMEARHGVSPIGRALEHSQALAPDSTGWVLRALLATSFLGAAGLFGLVAVASWRTRVSGWLVGLLAAGLGTAWIVLGSRAVAATYPGWADGGAGVGSLAVVQCGLFTVSGAWTILAATRLAGRFERANAILLGTWFWIGLVHVVASNWDVSMRAVLTAVVPAALIAAGRVETLAPSPRRVACTAAVVATFVVSALLAWGDHVVARACRDDARESAGPGVVFAGHWGFQHYAEEAGARPFDSATALVTERPTRIVVPMWNSFQQFPFDPSARAIGRRVDRPLNALLLPLAPACGAGFYAARLRPLPWSVSLGETMTTWVYDFAANPAQRPVTSPVTR